MKYNVRICPDRPAVADTAPLNRATWIVCDDPIICENFTSRFKRIAHLNEILPSRLSLSIESSITDHVDNTHDFLLVINSNPMTYIPFPR